jgi:hypothetical protein
VPLIQRGRGQRELLDAVENLVRCYRTNANRMKYRLFREDRLPIGSGAVESAHRHVLQTRMKRAGQRWVLRNARRMARLRAAYRTAGALAFYGAIRRARRETVTNAPRARARRQHFRYSRYGTRDTDRCERAASNRSSARRRAGVRSPRRAAHAAPRPAVRGYRPVAQVQPLTRPEQALASAASQQTAPVLQHGIAPLQGAPSAAQVWTEPQVPLVWPGGTLHTFPLQQSALVVHVPPAPMQAVTQVPLSRSQLPEQHWPAAVHVPPLGMQVTHLPPEQARVQHSAPVVQVFPVAVHWVVSRAHRNTDGETSWQLLGAQQLGSSVPEQVVPAALHVVTAVQCSTPFASGTHGAPAQHWSRNWHTLAVVRAVGSWAGMQQAGLFLS